MPFQLRFSIPLLQHLKRWAVNPELLTRSAVSAFSEMGRVHVRNRSVPIPTMAPWASSVRNFKESFKKVNKSQLRLSPASGVILWSCAKPSMSCFP